MNKLIIWVALVAVLVAAGTEAKSIREELLHVIIN